MKKTFKYITAFAFTSLLLLSCVGEEYTRGWYDAPWIRYEAEADACKGQCDFLPYSENKLNVQSEASHKMAASLVNKGDYLEWKYKEAAEGMVIRFSLPDAPQGGGTKGNVALYVDGDKVCDIELDSYHAWQWKNPGAGPFNWYFDNTPGEDRCSRMYYDEKRLLLAEKINKGEKFRLVKTDDNSVPYTIDFVELEPVPAPVGFDEVNDGNAVCYDGVTTLAQFVRQNQGKTIYLPKGRYESGESLIFEKDSTKLIGAGSWHTEICYTADPNDVATPHYRDIICSNKSNCCGARGIYFCTKSDRRYLNYHNEKTGLSGTACGMAFLGEFGDNFFMEDLWMEHFECATWITYVGRDSKVLNCRIRNNYADGLNIEEGENLLIERVNSRNNGDDQIAVHWIPEWNDKPVSTTIRNCTVELGWRAGGVAVVSGNNLNIHDIHIEDHLETGVRFLSEFPGHVYGANVKLHDISILNCGGVGGDPLEYGTYFGSASPAISFSNAGWIDINDITLENIDIINPLSYGIFIGGSGGSKITGQFKNITVKNWRPSFNGQDYYGLYIDEKAAGEISYSNLVLDGDEASKRNGACSNLIFEEIKQ